MTAEHDLSLGTSPEDDEESLQALGMFLKDDQEFQTLAPDSTVDPSGEGQKISARKDLNDALLKGESVQQRIQKVNASSTPLLEAVQPLLRALSEMPEEMANNEQAEVLKRTFKNEINIFSVVCDETEISWKKMAIVRYCICTALDEAAHTTPWGIAVGWSQSNLLNHFEGDNDGGNKFFLLVGRLSMHPHDYADVLDVLLRILGLGFEGRYSVIEEGERQLTKIRQRLLTLLQSTRERVPNELSPHGTVVRTGIKRRGFRLPVRVSLVVGAFLIASTFIWCKYHLLATEFSVQERLVALQNLKAVKPLKPMRLRLAVLLKAEIEKQLVTVDETQSESKVVFKSDSMFSTGSATVQPASIAILKRVANEIERVKGQVVIVGHTDSIPVHKADIPDNQVLSEKRAHDVAQILIAEGVPEKNIKIQGKGDRQPVADNSDSKGRALNRRVEIFVTY